MKLQAGLVILLTACVAIGSDTKTPLQDNPGLWRQQLRVIDLHQHIDCTTQHLARTVKIMDAAGVGLGVNLSGGTVTRPSASEPSEFERNKQTADTLFPGRFVHYMNLDYQGWDAPDFSERAAKQIEEGHRLGAAGFKEFKRLGLYLRDGKGQLIKIDDPKLDAVWDKCGELKMPVSIHVADPKAFWLPYNDKNERWKELKDHKSWWFGDTNKFPPWKSLLQSLSRVIERHPKTTFVCVHFANNAEELAWVDEALSRHPNMMADLAARIPEIGRHDPALVRKLFIKHQDRILFGTDFQVYDRLILGSSGNEPPPADADAEVFFAKEWRWLESRDQNWDHMTPIQGDWTISSIGLPTPVLRKIYFDNARKLLAPSLPVPVLRARRVSQDFQPGEKRSAHLWQTAVVVEMDQSASSGEVRPDMNTRVRALWSEGYLYLQYECPFTRLTTFEPVQTGVKRYNLDKPGASLWDRDVVEAFIAPDPSNLRHYAEFEVAPSNERLDLMVENLPEKDFGWNSGFTSAVTLDREAKIWVCEMRIPLQPLSNSRPSVGTRWRANLFRCDQASKAFLAWRPVMTGSFHTPERLGILEFVE